MSSWLGTACRFSVSAIRFPVGIIQTEVTQQKRFSQGVTWVLCCTNGSTVNDYQNHHENKRYPLMEQLCLCTGIRRLVPHHSSSLHVVITQRMLSEDVQCPAAEAKPHFSSQRQNVRALFLRHTHLDINAATSRRLHCVGPCVCRERCLMQDQLVVPVHVELRWRSPLAFQCHLDISDLLRNQGCILSKGL